MTTGLKHINSASKPQAAGLGRLENLNVGHIQHIHGKCKTMPNYSIQAMSSHNTNQSHECDTRNL